MKKLFLCLALTAVCGFVTAAETMDPAAAEPGKRPAGWKAYITGAKETQAESGTVEVREIDGKKVLCLEDKSAGHEYGIVRTVPCKGGEYFRITAKYRPADGATKFQGAELTAHFIPAQKFRAGTVRPDKSGTAVLDTVKAPEGTRALQIYFYILRPAKLAVLIDSIEIESSDTPFPAAK